MVAVEIEHGADAAVGADDVGLGPAGQHLRLELQQERRRAAVERLHLRQVEAHAGRVRGEQAAHLRPRRMQVAEAQPSGETELGVLRVVVDALDVEAGDRHPGGV
jgi:hypothetical protein